MGTLLEGKTPGAGNPAAHPEPNRRGARRATRAEEDRPYGGELYGQGSVGGRRARRRGAGGESGTPRKARGDDPRRSGMEGCSAEGSPRALGRAAVGGMARHASEGRQDPVQSVMLPAVLFFRDYYVRDQVGEGRFGSVWRCTHRVTGREVACKQIERRRGGSLALQREVECFSRVQTHPNILHLEAVYASDRFVYILTDLCNSGDLFDAIGEEEPMSEHEAREVFRQLARAVHHCHTHGVLHRDLKPENILLHTCPTTGQKSARLADFGLATQLARGEVATGWVGSEPYEAPEVVALEPYGFPADVFSLGVVLYGMLSGTWPAFEEGRRFNPAQDFSWPGWQVASAEAKDLLAWMMEVCPWKRPTLPEVLQHPWLLSAHASSTDSQEMPPLLLERSHTLRQRGCGVPLAQLPGVAAREGFTSRSTAQAPQLPEVVEKLQALCGLPMNASALRKFNEDSCNKAKHRRPAASRASCRPLGGGQAARQHVPQEDEDLYPLVLVSERTDLKTHDWHTSTSEAAWAAANKSGPTWHMSPQERAGPVEPQGVQWVHQQTAYLCPRSAPAPGSSASSALLSPCSVLGCGLPETTEALVPRADWLWRGSQNIKPPSAGLE